MPKTIDEYKQLDNQFNSTINDYDERLDVIYYRDKKHYCKAKLDIFSGILSIGENSSIWSKQHKIGGII